MTSTKNEFYGKLRSAFDNVQIYERGDLQQQARSCMPIDDFYKRAGTKIEELRLGRQNYKDLILIELLDWFHSFFKFVDKPKCEGVACGGRSTVFIGMATPNAEETQYQAGRVETYKCDNCQRIIRFPRYNHPGRLLQTRQGRCGELANCFTLCCRALDFDARYVLDWGDHVWTEVFSDNQQRWLHCDPCENVCDKPLLYEAGWGKKHTYIIAFSKNDIQDVTWRYSAKHAEVLNRRNEVSEPWLVGLIVGLRNERQLNLNAQQKRYLQERTVKELVEMMNTRSSSEEEHVGRQTGSIEWRMARGELGSNPARSSLNQAIVPTKKELEEKRIQLKYSCAKDLYMRGNEKVVGWTSLSYEAKNMMRKVEHDWNKVYLARTEGSPDALISWRVDLQSSGMLVDKVEIEVHSRCYESGLIVWELQGDERTVNVTSTEHRIVTDLHNSKLLQLTAKLSKGDGDVAWQHTQLFRQERTPKVGEDLEWPLNLVIYLK